MASEGHVVRPRRRIQGIDAPSFLYGTAWKEERTSALTRAAIRAGFRGIDTANQRKHYFEAGVGEAVADAIAAGEVARAELFLQTKFTFAAGQDHRLPYDPRAPYGEQVSQSFESSLDHLRTDYVDSYVLRGPSTRHGLSEADWEAWRSMEVIYKAGRAKLLGVSNVDREQLRLLLAGATVRPAFVQNRCYARLGWDASVRELCEAEGIVYQGFSLLTANVDELREPAVVAIAKRHGRSIAEVTFRFAMQKGMLPLTGTTSEEHMRLDLRAFEFELTAEDIAAIEGVARRQRPIW